MNEAIIKSAIIKKDIIKEYANDLKYLLTCKKIHKSIKYALISFLTQNLELEVQFDVKACTY
jgi:hypothetical protein